MLYKRNRTWWFQIRIDRQTFRESTGMRNKEAAGEVKRKRRDELMRECHGLPVKKVNRGLTFSIAAEEYLSSAGDWKPKMLLGYKSACDHLGKTFANAMLQGIAGEEVVRYRVRRLEDGAAPKTVSGEIATLRAILRFHEFETEWAQIRKRIGKLAPAKKVGRCILPQEEEAVLRECHKSRSRCLYPVVVLALHTGMRSSEIRLLKWVQIDLMRRTITVGEAKSEAGEGRVVPIDRFAYRALSDWASNFPQRKLNHYVFPSEKFGENGAVYDLDTSKPLGSWKEAWEHAKKRAGVSCRFHDLRHTRTTNLLAAGTPHPVVAEILGWSTSTAIRMLKVYGQVSLAMKQRAIMQTEQFLAAQQEAGAQKSAQQEVSSISRVQ